MLVISDFKSKITPFYEQKQFFNFLQKPAKSPENLHEAPTEN